MEILLADDHQIVRSGMKLLLQRIYTDAVITEAIDYPETLLLAEKNKTLDLILLDRLMPEMSDLNNLRNLHSQVPETPIVVISASENPAHVWQSLENGAKGYIPKTSSEDIMRSALALVLSGGIYLPQTLLEEHRGLSNSELTADDSNKNNNCSDSIRLTNRQKIVLTLLSEGKSNKKIAAELQISNATVHTHINAIFKVLNVTNRTEAVCVASKAGLTTNLGNIHL